MGSNVTLIANDAVAVIIAGGKSSRMKEDKALLPFGGYASLAEFQYERLQLLFSKVYISAKANKFSFEVSIIEDVNKIASPLVALVSIFEILKVDEVFVLSVDAPFVTAKVIEKLYAHRKENHDVIIATSNRGIEPLCAIYKRSFLTKAKEALINDNHRLQALLSEFKVKKVFFEEEQYFMNLNYSSEYKEALKREKEER